jgi:transcriptional regulator with XRE-family HTH domain
MAGASFGTTLRNLREQRGMSLGELSRLVHYSKSYLSRVENDQRAPGMGLVRSCETVLGADGLLTGLVAGRPQHQRNAQRPMQMPPDVSGFVGRAAELDLLDLLCPADSAALPLVVICGPPGVGKTALAVHWAHQAIARFPDGCLFSDLHGCDPVMPPADAAQVLGGFLRALGTAAERIPGAVEERTALLRTLLSRRRMLLLLDNVAGPAQVRPLLPGCTQSVVIVTSRGGVSGLAAREGAHRVRLQPLPEQEAVSLLGQALGNDRIAVEHEAAHRIARYCGGLPLALRIAADSAAARPAMPLSDIARQLSAERQRLDLLAVGDDAATAVRSAFSSSYQVLPDEAGRMFRLVSLHPGTEFGVGAAAALAAETSARAVDLLNVLGEAHLVDEFAPGRFRLHDLLRLYGAERAAAEETGPGRDAAIRRMLSFYLHAVGLADHGS